VFQLLLGELVPKSIAIRYPERLAMATTWVMQLSVRLFRPAIWLFNGTGTFLLRLIGVAGPAGHTHVHSPEEIELLVTESGGAGALDAIEREMLHNAFDLSQLMARHVMIPRNRLELADVETPVPVLLARLAASPYSRIPVYRDTPDNSLGIVHLKDLFRLSVTGGGRVEDVVRPVPIVPETLAVGELWQMLNQGQTYLALVIDEYGGLAGIVTQEDLLEEIIGEVHDEFDVETERIRLAEGGPALVRGDVLVADVNEALGVELPIDRTDTVGGLVMDALGEVAEVDDEVVINGVRLRVVAVRGRSVEQVAVQAPPYVDRPPGGAA
jgi:CBS domain containing-hemolysin-like protein